MEGLKKSPVCQKECSGFDVHASYQKGAQGPSPSRYFVNGKRAQVEVSRIVDH